jgi:hypothetical protein
MSVREIGITVVRHQESKRLCLRLHLWHPKGQPIDPAMIAALRSWEFVRPIDSSMRSAVGQLSASRIFIDIARAKDLRPPYRRRKPFDERRFTPSELRRQSAVGDRLWQLELWLVRWYGHGDKQAASPNEEPLVITHYYPEYMVHRITPLERRPPKN